MKLLIVRFSSFGDIVQAMGVPSAVRNSDPRAEIHWLTRSDFSDMLRPHPAIRYVWSLDKEDGLIGLLKLALKLRRQKFTHIYDAHNNLRSHLICWLVRAPFFLRRSKDRLKRLLLFTFRKNNFPKPFVGQKSYLSPLESWGIPATLPQAPQFFVPRESQIKVREHVKGLGPFTVIMPSSAWEMKNWPEENWVQLIKLNPAENFVIAGGPQDTVCGRIEKAAANFSRSGKILNLAGKLSLIESAALLTQSKLLIAADTGLLHVADQLGAKTLALIGPTAFGFPARSSSKVLEVSLDCRPCTKDGRGKCSNSLYQRCMVEISPELVSKELGS